MTRFEQIIVISAAADLTVFIAALWGVIRWRARGVQERRLGMAALLAAVGITGAFFVLKLPLLRFLGIDFFGLATLVYVDLAVVMPAAAASALLLPRIRFPGSRTRVTWPVKLAAIPAMAAAPLAAYASFYEPFQLRLEQSTVVLEDVDLHGEEVTVAVLADLQFSEVTEHEWNAIRMAMAQQPDIIMLPGDVFQGSKMAFEESLPNIRKLLGALHAPGGVYLVQGDAESRGRLREIVAGTDVTVLYNEVVVTQVRQTPITICGIELDYASPQARAAIARMVRRQDGDGPRLLLAHRPDVALRLDHPSRVDLVIAGHTHGGQVQIPGFGPIITMSRIPRDAAAGGLSVVNGARLYVSRGVGCERAHAPRMRFCCPPEVSLLTLTCR